MEIAKVFSEMKKKMEKRDRLDGSVKELLKKLRKKKKELRGCSKEIDDLKKEIQLRLNEKGLDVRRLEDFKLMSQLWEEGFDDFPVRLTRTISVGTLDRMKERYGTDLRFDYWSNSLKWISDFKLEEEIDYFDGAMISEVANEDRLLSLVHISDALQAETRRRQIENTLLQEPLQRQMFDHHLSRDS